MEQLQIGHQSLVVSYKVLLYLKYNYEMSAEKLESIQCVKDLGVMIVSNLKFSQQCKDDAGKANSTLGLIKRTFSFKNNDKILPLYAQWFSQTTLTCAVQFWLPHLAKT